MTKNNDNLLHKCYVVLKTIHHKEELGAIAWDVEPTLFISKEEAQDFINAHSTRTLSQEEWVTVKEFKPGKKFAGMTAEFRIRPVYLREDGEKCPKCGKTYYDHPALSRIDNKTEICPSCGLREAMEAFMKEKGIEADA